MKRERWLFSIGAGLLLLAFALALLATRPAPSPSIDGSPLDYFEFVQDGAVIPVVDGVVHLAPLPFVIRCKSTAVEASVVATTHPVVAEQCKRLPLEVTLSGGWGAAKSPGNLYAQNEPLDVYEGWSDEYRKTWKKSQGTYPRYLRLAMFKKTPPTILISGRNYGFTRTTENAQEYRVQSIDGLPLVLLGGKKFLVLLLMESPGAQQSSFYPARWSSVQLKFREGIMGQI